MRHRQADRQAGLLRAQHAAGRRAVPIKMIALAPERGRRAVGLAVDDIGDVADHGRIEHGIDRLLVVAAALVQAADLVAFADRKMTSSRSLFSLAMFACIQPYAIFHGKYRKPIREGDLPWLTRSNSTSTAPGSTDPAQAARRHRSLDRRGLHADRRGQCRRRRQGGRRRAQGLHELWPQHAQGAPRAAARHPGRVQEAPEGRGRRDLPGDGRATGVRAHHPGRPRRGASGAHDRGAGELRVRVPAGQHPDRARADRRVRPDHAVELADPTRSPARSCRRWPPAAPWC